MLDYNMAICFYTYRAEKGTRKKKKIDAEKFAVYTSAGMNLSKFFYTATHDLSVDLPVVT